LDGELDAWLGKRCHICLQMEIRKLANIRVPTCANICICEALGLGDGPQGLHASREDELGLEDVSEISGFGTKSIKTI
jgi:hypothetical protein